MKQSIRTLLWASLWAVALVYVVSCAKIDLVETTTTDVNTYSYLKKTPEKFSEFTAILDRAGYASFLDAYGAYTTFAPTNNGIKKYLQAVGKASATQLSVDELKDLVKLHIIQDTLTTKSFKDGKLPLVTMYGQYLLAGVSNTNGTSSYTLNRQASVTETNIMTGNGIVHVIDNVLQPAKLTVAKLIEQNAELSIFTEALKQTGLYDSLNVVNLNDPSRRWLTVMAETNKALAKAGFNSFNDLKKRYSNTGNPLKKEDSLNLYVRYHILSGAKYLADVITATSHATLAPLEVITSKLEEQTVLINDDEFNGVRELGIVLDRPTSDNSATNGVLHLAQGHFAIKVRKPIPIYWDVADFSEIRKLPAYFRKKNYDFAFASVKDVTWEKNSITYVWGTSASFPTYWGDYLMIPLGTQAARNLWVEFKTPMLVRGRYKVWVCYRYQRQSSGSTNVCQVNLDGEPLTRPVIFTDQAPAGTAGELEALGWKLFSDSGTDRNMAGRMVGVVNIATTDRHTIRLQSISGGQNNNNLDMIHFIPIEMNQISPRFGRDGSLIK